MRKFKIYLLSFLLFAYCGASEVSVQEVAEDTTTSTTSTSTTSTTTTVVEPIEVLEPIEENLNEYGQEILVMGPEMKEQFDELISFVEKRTGLKFSEYPKYELYTLEGYRDYSVASYLDYFEEDYEEGEWERAVLSEQMWGLTTMGPDELKDLYVTFQRCASSGSYNLEDKTLRIPIKRNQNKFNLFEQSVLIHELTHTLQGQVIDLSGWYNEMKDADGFSDYYGRRSIMEGQADLIQERWESGLDSYDRQTMQSQYPAGCGVTLPPYMYIPFDLYYGFGPIVVKGLYENGGMEAINDALYLLPTGEEIYKRSNTLTSEPYQEVEINDLEIEGYSLIDEGTIDSLDIVYLLQGNTGIPDTPIKAAIGLGGGAWKDYVDSRGALFMSLKISGDNVTELNEIHDAFIDWAERQDRFQEFIGGDWAGKLFIGETSFWIDNDGDYVRMILALDNNLLKEVLSDCSSAPCKQDF